MSRWSRVLSHVVVGGGTTMGDATTAHPRLGTCFQGRLSLPPPRHPHGHPQAAEARGRLCRDDSINGVRFYLNRFLERAAG
jgi:hypothetical protein